MLVAVRFILAWLRMFHSSGLPRGYFAVRAAKEAAKLVASGERPAHFEVIEVRDIRAMDAFERIAKRHGLGFVALPFPRTLLQEPGRWELWLVRDQATADALKNEAISTISFRDMTSENPAHETEPMRRDLLRQMGLLHLLN